MQNRGQNGTPAESMNSSENNESEGPFVSYIDSNVGGDVDDEPDITIQGVHLDIRGMVTENIGQLANEDGELPDDTVQADRESAWKVVGLAQKRVLKLKKIEVAIEKGVPKFPNAVGRNAPLSEGSKLF